MLQPWFPASENVNESIYRAHSSVVTGAKSIINIAKMPQDQRPVMTVVDLLGSSSYFFLNQLTPLESKWNCNLAVGGEDILLKHLQPSCGSYKNLISCTTSLYSSLFACFIFLMYIFFLGLETEASVAHPVFNITCYCFGLQNWGKGVSLRKGTQ